MRMPASTSYRSPANPWAVATQRPADSQTAPSAAATGPVRVKAWSKNPAVLPCVTGDPQRSSGTSTSPFPPPAAMQRCSPAVLQRTDRRLPWPAAALRIAFRCQRKGAKPQQAQTGPFAVIAAIALRASSQPSRCLLACLVAARPQLSFAILGPDPHSAPCRLPPAPAPAAAAAAAALRIIQPPIQWWARPSVWVTGSYFEISSRSLPLSLSLSISQFSLGKRTYTPPPPPFFSLLPLPYPSFARTLRRRGVTSCLSNLGRSITHPRYPRREQILPGCASALEFTGLHATGAAALLILPPLSHDQTPSCVLHESQTPIGLRPL
ncbi:uncharacterized protein Triagg1_4060 [Trichoderma aggressivum f. europaeum]|uniref:Uncharacterized protein n=1 Tax=Trichoderma aggressivum f. europaeum TaxID=173218 RepID=A0AAE1JC55_9HYPO|nr:hypothetical protein Triagg1_4060 [Trichoderma aggressivum f. europaeum]